MAAKSLTSWVLHIRTSPSERVKDNRIITVDGVWVSWWQTQVSHLDLIAGNPVLDDGEARIEGGPPYKENTRRT